MDKVVFMGSDAIALPLLKWLREAGPSHGAELVAVFSQPDRPKGRGKKLQPNPVSAWSLEEGVQLFRPDKPTEADEDWLRSEGVSLVLVMAYGHILKKSLLAVPPRGFINFHASILPKFRGASPVESAVATGESETGVSLMRIVPKMDAGPIYDVERVPVEALDTGGIMREKLSEASVPLLERNYKALLDGTAESRKQDESEATYCRKLDKTDGALDFTQSASTLAARINGLDPWPGCYAEHGEVRLKFRGATAHPYEGGESSGTVLEPSSNSVQIVTGTGILSIAELQRPGGKMLPAQEFLRGYDLKPGSALQSATMTDLLVTP